MTGCGAETGDQAQNCAPSGGCPQTADPSGHAQACATSSNGPSWYATRVVTSAFGTGQSFGRDKLPGIVLGPPSGGGTGMGSLDVASLGNGGSMVLGFDCTIVDGPGPDFVVFENAFYTSGEPNKPFAEPATVAVSQDGTTWKSFPCPATAAADGTPAPPFGTCAGWHPVLSKCADPDQPVALATAGGDPFDLAELGVAEARFVRITDRADLKDPVAGVFDLDAVGIVHGTCP